MRKIAKKRLQAVLVVLLLAGLMLSAWPARAASFAHCETGTQDSGAIYEICMPPDQATWNGSVLIYAHGYVGFDQPIGIPVDHMRLQDGNSIEEIITRAGYAFATTSYSINGLAVLPAVQDVVELAQIFRAIYPLTRQVYLAGVSEGGLVTTLAVERYPQFFDGGLALCGPIGDFQRQINYWGDFRVLFDDTFPGLLPGTAMNVPYDVIRNFYIDYWPRIEQAVQDSPERARLLLKVANAPYDPDRPETLTKTVYDLIWYSVFSTNNGQAVLSGQPYSNLGRMYRGSGDDEKLNVRVPRFRADELAVQIMAERYNPTGRLSIPLVTMHHTRDQIVPYFHEELYSERVQASGSGHLYTHIPINRYGHCDFNSGEVLAGFSMLVYNATGQLPVEIGTLLANAQTRQDFTVLIRDWALPALELALPGLGVNLLQWLP